MIDSKSTSSIGDSPDLLVDGLPSYDSATSFPLSTTPQPGGSTSGAASSSTDAAVSAQQAYLFAGPSNAEPLKVPSTRGDQLVCNRQTEVTRYTSDLSTTRVTRVETYDPAGSDPAVLYDFLANISGQIPKVRLQITGYHTETPAQDQAVTINGVTVMQKKGETVKISDFNFFIDLTDIISPAGVHLSVLPGYTPEYRGKMCAAYGAKFSPSQGGQDGYAPLSTDDAPAHVSVGSGRPISWGAHDVFAKWDGKRWMQGLPIWAKPQDIRLEGVNQPGDPGHRDGDIEQARGKQGEPALTAWCQAYCADRGWLKEFILRKEVWGWDYGALSKAIKGAVVSTGYTTEVEVKLNWDEQEAMVMPSNPWTRINNETFYHVILCITLIYPLVYFFRYLCLLPWVGGRYNIARATYNLKPYPPLPSTYPSETIHEAQSRLPGLMKTNPQLPAEPVLRLGPKGVHYLAGKREGEWFAQWEERIKMAAQTRFRGELTLGPTIEPREVSLDGYQR